MEARDAERARLARLKSSGSLPGHFNSISH